jgi:hypothetical protein
MKTRLANAVTPTGNAKRPNVIGLVGLGIKVERAYRRQHLSEGGGSDVGIVMMNQRARQIADRAEELAREGREEADAITELSHLAGSHRHDLEVAAMFLRSEGSQPENRITDGAARLTRAALTGTAVVPPSAEEEALMAAVEVLNPLDNEEVFRRMAALEPRLAELGAAVRAGRFRPQSTETREPAGVEQRRAHFRAKLQAEKKLRDALADLAGPASRATDPALRSRTVRDRLYGYLEGAVGHGMTDDPSL